MGKMYLHDFEHILWKFEYMEKNETKIDLFEMRLHLVDFSLSCY